MDKYELEEAFIAMIRRYERTIYKVCVCYTSPEWPLADLYQESVCRLWAGFPMGIPGDSQYLSYRRTQEHPAAAERTARFQSCGGSGRTGTDGRGAARNVRIDSSARTVGTDGRVALFGGEQLTADSGYYRIDSLQCRDEIETGQNQASADGERIKRIRGWNWKR